MIAVKVEDSPRRISTIDVVEETPSVVVLLIDLNEKRCEVECFSDRMLVLGEDEPFSVVTIEGDQLGDDGIVSRAETSKYTCLVVWARASEAMRNVYVGPARQEQP